MHRNASVRGPRARRDGSDRRTGRWRRARRGRRPRSARRPGPSRPPAASRTRRACRWSSARAASSACTWLGVQMCTTSMSSAVASSSGVAYARSAPRRSAASRPRSGDDVATPARRAPASRAERAWTPPMKPAPIDASAQRGRRRSRRDTLVVAHGDVLPVLHRAASYKDLLLSVKQKLACWSSEERRTEFDVIENFCACPTKVDTVAPRCPSSRRSRATRPAPERCSA